MHIDRLAARRKECRRYARAVVVHILKGACTAIGTALVAAVVTWLQQ